MAVTDDTLSADVLIIGAGPAGLATAIRLKQLAPERHVIVLEKAAQVGDHVLSGCVFDPKALDALLPEWQTRATFSRTPVTHDGFAYLSTKRAWSWPLPLPSNLNNHGNLILSLGALCRYLASEAEGLGVEIYTGFAGAAPLFEEQDQKTLKKLIGVHTQDGTPIMAKQTILAEGCRGSLSQQLIAHFDLAKQASKQTYGLGLKELWEVPHDKAGSVLHTVGYPLGHKPYGGGFVYHLNNNQVYIGFVVGLDYDNPYFDPYESFQQFKTHPSIRAYLEGGRCLSYGARALNEGGYQSIPELAFPGGVLVGCAAGFLDVPRIKGSHTAIQSGIFAAESIHANWDSATLPNYRAMIDDSWVGRDLKRARNVRPAFQYGLWAGLAYSGLDYCLLRGAVPWTFKHHADHMQLQDKQHAVKLTYPAHDGVVSFDRMTSVARSNTFHPESAPKHLKLKDPNIPIDHNLKHYDCPETRYCPAGVYELVEVDGKQQMQINAQNCLHCKTCDIKDPLQNIVWTVPESGGPSYGGL